MFLSRKQRKLNVRGDGGSIALAWGSSLEASRARSNFTLWSHKKRPLRCKDIWNMYCYHLQLRFANICRSHPCLCILDICLVWIFPSSKNNFFFLVISHLLLVEEENREQFKSSSNLQCSSSAKLNWVQFCKTHSPL